MVLFKVEGLAYYFPHFDQLCISLSRLPTEQEASLTKAENSQGLWV